ncbi:LysR family transcriptional regulator [Rhodobacteraceae bacterium N5(2021)]|uniref:LysR family transcriptional regulator n=1 Tax=Gymnodinialimonas phycosphaerae TaxID=2841589 RepID=A0A975TRY4_9RHOB|nr:LysR family transcriptional regulator [Gymnodinialimonas phycosphaerae]MBY4893844.1 LysR family transcriptional regulator [Gymnodinialimonas phycosphaerae]
MTIRLLRTLVAVADAKTFSAAAEVVHVTHAAVSQQMQALEADLGVALFNRATRTPELTPIAHQIVAKARVLLADYDGLVASVLDEDGLSGDLRLGALGTTLTGLTPRAMAVLKDRFPGIGLHIRPGLTGELLADIERGALDAAIVSKPHLLPPRIHFRPFAQEPLQLIAPFDEPSDDPFELLRIRPFIRFNRNAVLGTLIENWILSKRVQVSEAMELNSAEAISSMVQAGLGVSIVPDLAVKPQDGVQVKRLALGGDAPIRVLGLASHRDQIKPRVIDEVFDALISVIPDGQTITP